jgi:hypothetical protein
MMEAHQRLIQVAGPDGSIAVRDKRQVLAFIPVGKWAGHYISFSESIQAASGGYPNIPFAVLQCGDDPVIGEAVALGELLNEFTMPPCQAFGIGDAGNSVGAGCNPQRVIPIGKQLGCIQSDGWAG